jgi:inosose dehydratase
MRGITSVYPWVRPPVLMRRREFLLTTGAAALGAPLPARAATGGFSLPLGYAAITWGGNDEQAIDDIAAVGFHGIQLRSPVMDRYGDKPEELRRRLADKGLSLTCLSSGTVDADPGREQQYLETHARNARFVKAVGGTLLQLISRRPKDRAPTPEEFDRLGRLLTEIGRRASEVGVRLVYHNHMGAFGQAPDEVARVLSASDPRSVGFLLDIAHYQQGGGDTVAAVSRHRDRLAIVHLKDVISPVPGDTRPPAQSYKWVELGRGKVDVPGVITALKAIRFRGPAVIELDAVPDPGRTPKESAEINKRYVVEKLGLSL